MERGVEDGGMKGEDMEYMKVEGSCSGVGEVCEVKGMKDLFGEDG